jgi:ABC-type multidrug transport system fused ATPase/permease subunit
MFRKLYSIFDYTFKFKFFYLIFLTLIVTVLEMLSMGLIIPITYFFFNNQTSEIYLINVFFDYVNVFSQILDVDRIIVLFLIVLFVFFVKFLFLIYYVFYQSKFNANLQVFISSKMLNKFGNISFSEYSKENSSLLLRNINNETNILANNVSLPIIQITSEASIIIGMMALLLMVNISVTIITFMIFSAAGFFLVYLTKRSLVKAGYNRQKYDNLRINDLNLIHGGFKELKVLNKINFFISKYLYSNKMYTDAYKKQIALSQLPRLLLEIITISSLLVLLIFMLGQSNSYAQILTYLSIFAGCSFKMMPSANRILRSLQLLKFGKSSLDTIISFLKEKNRAYFLKDESDNYTSDESFLSIKKLNFFYIDGQDNKKHVIKDLDLSAVYKTAIGIIGESGSGKTTLFNLITGLDKPSSGKIFNYKKNIHNDIIGWRSKIGYVPQEIFLFEGSVKKNVALLDESEISEERVIKALKLAQIDKFFLDQENGLDTRIGERGINISGGQKQRVGIARALYNNPKLLIFDEATSALDEKIEEELMKSIYNLQEKLSMIIISHKPSILLKCNTIYKMQNGQLIKVR